MKNRYIRVNFNNGSADIEEGRISPYYIGSFEKVPTNKFSLSYESASRHLGKDFPKSNEVALFFEDNRYGVEIEYFNGKKKTFVLDVIKNKVIYSGKHLKEIIDANILPIINDKVNNI